jgi:hypothetical protein
MAAVNPSQGKSKARPTTINPTVLNNNQGSEGSMDLVKKDGLGDRGGIAIGKFSVFSGDAD